MIKGKMEIIQSLSEHFDFMNQVIFSSSDFTYFDSHLK